MKTFNEKLLDDATVQIALAPKGWAAKQVILYLTLDPYQSRVSSYPIRLTNPRTGRSLVLKEYIEEILTASRFAIETTDALVFVSRLSMGSETIFKPLRVIPKDHLRQ